MADEIDTFNPVAAFMDLAARVNGDDFLVHRGRFLTADILVKIGDVPFIVAIEKGRIAAVERGPFPLRPWSSRYVAPNKAGAVSGSPYRRPSSMTSSPWSSAGMSVSKAICIRSWPICCICQSAVYEGRTRRAAAKAEGTSYRCREAGKRPRYRAHHRSPYPSGSRRAHRH